MFGFLGMDILKIIFNLGNKPLFKKQPFSNDSSINAVDFFYPNENLMLVRSWCRSKTYR